MRFNDPRRFGAMLWVRDPAHHELLDAMGVEPFDEAFTGKCCIACRAGGACP